MKDQQKAQVILWKVAEAAWQKHDDALKAEQVKAEQVKAETAWIAERGQIQHGGIRKWEATHPKPKKTDPQWTPEGRIEKPKLCQKVTKVAAIAEDSSGEKFDLDVSSDDKGEE